jgi:hypothetical protein
MLLLPGLILHYWCWGVCIFMLIELVNCVCIGVLSLFPLSLIKLSFLAFKHVCLLFIC